MAFSPDAELLACGRDGHVLQLWSARKGEHRGVWLVPQRASGTGPVRAVAFSPDGTGVVGVGSNGAVELYAVQ